MFSSTEKPLVSLSGCNRMLQRNTLQLIDHNKDPHNSSFILFPTTDLGIQPL
uniref:Nucleoid-associated protein At4g30620ic n=1 Tax=Rhizophora mucronata TaxID=61149 RepID=A0A2P2KU97_RHIMU